MTAEEFPRSVAQFNRVASPDHLTERALNMVRVQRGENIGAPVDLYEHALQCATRAYRDGADEETVVCVLLHDVGELMTPVNHGELPAALLRPYVTPENFWVLAHHEIFQAFYFQDAAKLTKRNSRDQFRDHPHFAACERFCERWDQPSFDPAYESLPLEFFEPMVRRIFARAPYWHKDHGEDAISAAKMETASAYPAEGREVPNSSGAGPSARL